MIGHRGQIRSITKLVPRRYVQHAIRFAVARRAVDGLGGKLGSVATPRERAVAKCQVVHIRGESLEGVRNGPAVPLLVPHDPQAIPRIGVRLPYMNSVLTHALQLCNTSEISASEKKP